jgi:RNA polymerase sigma-70 factor, ECF subfamily
LLEAGMRLRRRAWQEREVVLDPAAWPQIADAGESPQQRAETGELTQALKHSTDGCLTEYQREVLVALALKRVPLDVLAERLSTTSGALYKTLHDGGESCAPTSPTNASCSTRPS